MFPCSFEGFPLAILAIEDPHFKKYIHTEVHQTDERVAIKTAGIPIHILAWSLSVHQNLQNPSFSMPITIQNLVFLAFLREKQYKKSSPSRRDMPNLDVLLPPNHRLPAAATLPAQDDLQSPGRFHPKHSSVAIIILSIGERNVYIIVYLSIIILYVYIYDMIWVWVKIRDLDHRWLGIFLCWIVNNSIIVVPNWSIHIDMYIIHMTSVDIKPATSHVLQEFTLGCGVYYPLFVLRKSRFLIIILLSHQTN